MGPPFKSQIALRLYQAAQVVPGGGNENAWLRDLLTVAWFEMENLSEMSERMTWAMLNPPYIGSPEIDIGYAAHLEREAHEATADLRVARWVSQALAMARSEAYFRSVFEIPVQEIPSGDDALPATITGICPMCDGTRKIWAIRVKNKKLANVICPACNGRGYLKEKN